jgi:uncharacterized protein (TIGR02217 family)
MSNAVFPVLAGLTWDVIKTPEFATSVQRGVSGREIRVQQRIYPLWTFQVQFELLRDDPTAQSPASPFNELKQLLGHFLIRAGQWDSFLYTDPSDSLVTDQAIGTGDGSNKNFQLVRAYGGFIEPVNNATIVTNVKDNGTIKTPGTDYNVSATGLVTFTSAPVAGHAITWTGTYYYRVRITTDTEDFKEFYSNLWENRSFSFVGSPMNKV